MHKNRLIFSHHSPPQTSIEIEPTEPLVNYGLDSKQSLQLIAELENWMGLKSIGVSIPSTLAYDYPTARAISLYLSGDIECQSSLSFGGPFFAFSLLPFHFFMHF